MSHTAFGTMPPWHLWGNTQRLTLQPYAVGNPPIINQQTLLRVRYGRPETWRFLFAFEIVAGGSATVGAEQATVAVEYQLIVGIGRSMIKIRGFLEQTIDWSGGFQPRRNQLVFQTATLAQPSIPFPANPVERTVIDQFVAQDITLEVFAHYFTDVAAPVPAEIEVHGQVAPNTHVRPDWYQIGKPAAQQFPGGEVGGS